MLPLLHTVACCLSMNLPFKLDPTVKSSIPVFASTCQSPQPLQSTFQLKIATSEPLPEDSSSPYYGAYAKDIAKGTFSLQWDSTKDMLMWLQKEQSEKLIELQRKSTNHIPDQSTKVYYVCACRGTGGIKEYTKKHPLWEWKVELKRDGCPCSLVVKSYPETPKLLGKYHQEHSYPTGNTNVRYTSLSKNTHMQISEMLHMGISHANIVHGFLHSYWDNSAY